jgi:hypothetical protein
MLSEERKDRNMRSGKQEQFWQIRQCEVRLVGVWTFWNAVAQRRFILLLAYI